MTDTFHKNPKTPQIRRERTLERRVNLLLGFIFLQFFAISVLSAVYIYKADVPIVIDHDTGEVIGDYRTAAFRSQEELINGGIRFVDHMLSLNSSTIRRDQLIAIQMMEKSLKEKRIEYLKQTNLIPKIEKAKSTSHLKYDASDIIFAKGSRMRVEYRGYIVLTNLKKTQVPFHMIVDLASAPITENNTTGVKVVAYNDF